MDSRQLRYFRFIVDFGSFTHAAEALDMTQPSLSLSLRKLEQELGMQLLKRTRSGVTMTEPGRIVYKTALKVDSLFAETSRRLREIADGQSSSITLCATPEFSWAFIPELLQEMRAKLPDIRIILEDPDPCTTLSRVRGGSVDVGLIPCTDPKTFAHKYAEELNVSVAAEFPLVVALPKRLGHLPQPVHLSAIAGETWILPAKNPDYIGVADVLDTLWTSHPNSKPAHIQEISSIPSSLPLLANGAGVSLLPDIAAPIYSGIEFRTLAEDCPPLYAVLIYRKEQELSPAAEQLIDFVKRIGTRVRDRTEEQLPDQED